MIGPGRRLIKAYLAHRGFRPAPCRTPGATAFRGELRCRSHTVPIQLEIEDWNFVHYPKIFVLKRPLVLTGFRPHIGLGQQLCYLQKGEVLLDAYDPVGMIQNCLSQAEKVLHDISGDIKKIDRSDEFLANWRGGKLALIADEIANAVAKPQFLGFTFISPPKKAFTFLLIGKNPSQLSSRLQSIGYHGPEHYLQNCLVLHLDTPPCFDPDHWPPNTLGELLAWLKVLDFKAYKVLLHCFESEWIIRHKTSAILFRSSAGSFGLTFAFVLPAHLDIKYFKKRPADLRQRILKSARSVPIERFSSMEITPEFIHGRNQGRQSMLAGLKINLVGCGTIGGHLSTYLTRLGAGANGGELVLIDFDLFWASNLGRHVLGMKHLFSMKADALAEHLQEEFPYLKITPRSVDVLSFGKLFECDLVIDATGEEAVSIVINHRHVKRRDRQPPVLYAWIEGAGYAVKTLLVDNPKMLCYQCQFLRSPEGERRERFPALLDASANTRQIADCEAFTPFPVSASVSAASLALEVIMDWRRGKPGHRLRSRRLSEQHTENRKDSSPNRLASCAECGN